MDYVKLKVMADRLLTGAGMEITLSRYDSISGYTKGYDPVKRMVKWTNNTDLTVLYEAPAGLPTYYKASGIRSFFKASEVDGVRIKQGDVKLILSTDFPEPKAEDKFILPDGSEYIYVNHEKKAPSITELIYIVQVRN